jgi:hypothetical protein
MGQWGLIMKQKAVKSKEKALAMKQISLDDHAKALLDHFVQVRSLNSHIEILQKQNESLAHEVLRVHQLLSGKQLNNNN